MRQPSRTANAKATVADSGAGATRFALPARVALLLAAMQAAAATSLPMPAGAGAPRPAFAPPAAEALLAGKIDQARLQQAVRELVRLGPRMGGTPSGDRAAAAIAAAFTGGGLVTDRKPQAMVRAARAIGIALLRLAFPPAP